MTAVNADERTAANARHGQNIGPAIIIEITGRDAHAAVELPTAGGQEGVVRRQMPPEGNVVGSPVVVMTLPLKILTRA